MKKVYVPTMDELYLMQDMVTGYNLYKYILIKVIETLIIDGINLKNKSILKNISKNLKEHSEIAYAICRLYPEEIKYSEYAQNDIKLCLSSINRKNDQNRVIYNLDNLQYFENGVGVLTNNGVIQTTANILAKELPNNPRYRFEYKQSSLLDDIFAREIPAQELAISSKQDFINIEPAYVLITTPNSVIPSSNDKKIALYHSINNYAERYGITGKDGRQYSNKDILTNPDEQVKRLLKCIKEHNK